MRNLPWFEDVLDIYLKYSINNTFPSKDFPTVFTAIIHIIGFFSIYIGIFLPPKYLPIYVIYLALIYLSYYIFDNNCIMTLLTNIDTNMTQTPIYIRMKTASNFIRNMLLISIIGILIPNLSPFRIIKSIILKLEP